jgi:regulator of cell morphogenesis and NO signaling
MTDLTPDTRVGDIAARHPLATRVFARHGIDFCCGGGAPLRQACERRGLAAATVLAEIDELLAGSPAPGDDWLAAPPAALVRHIVTTYHVPLRQELPRLETMARKVAQVHAERDPERRLPAILATLLALSAELADHMAREEEALFPAILAGGAGEAGAPLQPFVDDHTAAGEKLARLRVLTDDYTPPADACNTWRALWAGLADLEAAMHQHVHLENNVLFARASAG